MNNNKKILFKVNKNKQANNIYTRFVLKIIMILGAVIFINLLSTKIQAIDLKYDSTDLEIFDGYGGAAMTDWNNTIDGDKIIYVSRGEIPKASCKF